MSRKKTSPGLVPAAILVAVLLPCIATNALGQALCPPEQNLKKAAEYSSAFRGVAILVLFEGRVVFEEYGKGGGPEVARDVSFATMAFTGVVAAAAAHDGLLSLDEKVCETIHEWNGQAPGMEVTVRHLLSLVSGLAAGGERGRPSSYADSTATRFDAAPGSRFTFGQAPYQVFGELLRRKLALRNETVMSYIEQRVLQPAGVRYGSWRRHDDLNPLLATGLCLTAGDFARLGELVRRGGAIDGREIIAKKHLDECFSGTAWNPAFGLGWWLNREVPAAVKKRIPKMRVTPPELHALDFAPKDLVMALGAGKQQLFVAPSAGLVVVRQADGRFDQPAGETSGFSEATFLRLLFTGECEWAPPRPELDAPSARAKRLINVFDRDGDGKVSLSEAPDRIKRHFDFFDEDRDGHLNGNELEKAFDWANTGGR